MRGGTEGCDISPSPYSSILKGSGGFSIEQRMHALHPPIIKIPSDPPFSWGDTLCFDDSPLHEEELEGFNHFFPPGRIKKDAEIWLSLQY